MDPRNTEGPTTTQPGRDCSEQLLFSTSSFPDSRMICYDSRGQEMGQGQEMKVQEDTLMSPGTTCMFLSSGHLDQGFVLEFLCQYGHWAVTLDNAETA